MSSSSDFDSPPREAKEKPRPNKVKEKRNKPKKKHKKKKKSKTNVGVVRTIKKKDPYISTTSLTRLCKTTGVQYMRGKVPEMLRLVLYMLLNNLMKNTVLYCEHRKAKVIQKSDICMAIKKIGMEYYG